MRPIFLFTVTLIFVFFLVDFAKLGHWIHPQKWIILSFFFFLSYLFERLNSIGLEKGPESFIPFFLSTVVIRLIASLLFIGLELYWQVPDKKLFIVNFFVLYLCYTIFELIVLSRKLRRF